MPLYMLSQSISAAPRARVVMSRLEVRYDPSYHDPTWFLVAEGGLDLVRDELLGIDARNLPLAPGALLRIAGSEQTVELYVVDRECRVVEAPQTLEGLTPFVEQDPAVWIDAWEGDDSRADTMLAAVAYLVPRDALVRAACACARTTLPRWDRLYYEDDPRPLNAIEMAEQWAHGEVDSLALSEASDAVRSLDAEFALAWCAACLACDTIDYPQAAAMAAEEAAKDQISEKLGDRRALGAKNVYDRALREMASLVQEHLPLGLVLLSVLEEEAPEMLPC